MVNQKKSSQKIFNYSSTCLKTLGAINRNESFDTTIEICFRELTIVN